MFARVLREYGLSFDAVLGLSLKRFWFLSNQIDRLRAEDDQRQMLLLAAVNSKDLYEATHKHLKEQVGTVYVWERRAPKELKIDPVTGLDPEFDREGLRALKRKLAAS